MLYPETHFCTTRVSLLLAASLVLNPAAFAETARLNVPFVHQEKNGCGSASIEMVEAYWRSQQVRVAPSARAESLSSLAAGRDEGTLLADMRRYLDSNGYYAFSIRASTADIRQQIAKGRALIVALEMKHGSVGLHYVVVTGIDERIVFVNDPAKRKFGSMERAKFEAAWVRAGRWMLLGVPRPTDSD